MTNKFTIKLSWSKVTNDFKAELFEIPALTASGDTKFDAINNLEKEVKDLELSLKQKGSSLEDYAKKYEVERVDCILKESIRKIENQESNCFESFSIPTGFVEIDRETQGLQSSELIVVGGRTGMGKTAFSLSIALNAALDFEKSVAIFTTETDKERLIHKILSNKSEVIPQKIRNADLSNEEWERLNSAVNKLTEAQIFIDDSTRLSFFELQTKCRKLKERNGLDLIVIDHLQSIRTPNLKEHQTKDQEIGDNCRFLKELAKELKVPIITTAQLSRAVDSRYGEKTPNLTDISESGIIEQVADMIIFIYRPEYYYIPEFDDGMPSQGLANIILAKNRNGFVNNYKVRFQGEFAKFSDIGEVSKPHGSDFNFVDENSFQATTLNKEDVPF